MLAHATAIFLGLMILGFLAIDDIFRGIGDFPSPPESGWGRILKPLKDIGLAVIPIIITIVASPFIAKRRFLAWRCLTCKAQGLHRELP